MADMLSPGVYISEIDVSTIVPNVSNSVGVFCGNFTQGPIDSYLLITTVNDLITYFGKPTDANYNDWYQAYNFLQYGNNLLVSRAANVTGTSTIINGCTVSYAPDPNTESIITVSDVSGLSVGMYISFGSTNTGYEIIAIDGTAKTITLDRNVENPSQIITGTNVNSYTQIMNGVAEVSDSTNVTSTAINGVNYNIANNAVVNNYNYLGALQVIQNYSDFETKYDSLAFSNPESKLKFFARNPGTWSNNVNIMIANPSSFEANSPSPSTFVTRYVTPGISVDSLFEYAPTGTQIAVIIMTGSIVQETFVVDLNISGKDYNNRSTYIETVINANSNYVYVKDNISNQNGVADYCLIYNTSTTMYVGSAISLVYGIDSEITLSALTNAYDLFSNKEEIDVDIIIGNEFDMGASAKLLVDAREDCIAFIGANYSDIVGQKSAVAISNLVDWRRTGSLNFDDMFMVACGNYKYQYDLYNDKYRWMNIAGDIAGLRAQTSANQASWYASAGLERGQIQNVIKLAFNPTQGQRDMLYKNGINPICTFPGQGTVMWGQKTLLSTPSSFDRVNVRGLFNTLERSLGKMAKYQVMEFNDNFTRNRIVSMIKPFLTSVQAGRGIQNFLVVCDESNNTPAVIANNQLVVDIYIQPTYVAEFIQLRFTNAGTNSFASIIGS